MVSEGIWGNGRFQYVEQLKHLGANIDVEGHIAIIEGGEQLQGSEVEATDLRAGSAMVLAGLIADGSTIVTNTQYIERGYEGMVEKLQSLGAHIERVGDNEPHILPSTQQKIS